MNSYETYYRRSYNAINKLIEVYRNGYDEKTALKFREELINRFKTNPEVLQSEINNIKLTAIIALLGLNKEAIETTGKIVEYKKNNNELDLSKLQFSEEEQQRLKEFNDSRTTTTSFDNWLSIQINPNTDKDNIDYLRRVRNALLHSNFYIDEKSVFLPFVKLKTKSYYEAELFNLQFQLFVFEYFGNIESLGLTETIYTFEVPQKQIINRLDFMIYLSVMNVVEISYKNLETLGVESPEFVLKDSLDEDCYIDKEKLYNGINRIENLKDIKFERNKINENERMNVINYVEENYGEEFYKLDHITQEGIISTHLKYRLNPKIEISNWMSHFWYLFSSVTNPLFNISFFKGDEFGTESCYPALMVLKSYLLMYRLQNNAFDELDYSKINFDISDKDILMYSENKDKTPVVEDYFQKSFDKEKSKGVLTEDKEIWNKVICEVVRDSLAHGNVKTFTSPRTNQPMIELKDIDPKKGTTRVIELPLSKYEDFLNSEAFKPSNCYKKEVEKVKKKI